jgi:hypothetical protein
VIDQRQILNREAKLSHDKKQKGAEFCLLAHKNTRCLGLLGFPSDPVHKGPLCSEAEFHPLVKFAGNSIIVLFAETSRIGDEKTRVDLAAQIERIRSLQIKFSRFRNDNLSPIHCFRLVLEQLIERPGQRGSCFLIESAMQCDPIIPDCQNKPH